MLQDHAIRNNKLEVAWKTRTNSELLSERNELGVDNQYIDLSPLTGVVYLTSTEAIKMDGNWNLALSLEFFSVSVSLLEPATRNSTRDSTMLNSSG
jgi:hypothetical protein